MLYRVRNWDGNFENNRTRQIECCTHVWVPNKQHGLGFTYLLSQKDGAAVIGIWYLIVEACSLQKLPREGYLTDTGKPDGRVWTAKTLALRWRRPVSEIERALELLSSEDVGWIEVVEPASPGRHSGVTTTSPDCEMTATETETETETGTGTGTGTRQEAAEFAKAWNGLGAPFPQVRVWTDARKKALKARLADEFFLANWRQGIEAMKRSAFCRGQGRNGWIADLEFFLRPDTVAKLLEGKYSGTPTAPPVLKPQRTPAQKREDAELQYVAQDIRLNPEYAKSLSENHPAWKLVPDLARKYGKTRIPD